MKKHVQILAWLYLALGILGILGALVAFGALTSIGLFTRDLAAFGILSFIGGLAGFYLLAVSIPNLIVGVGLLQNWGGWVLILAVVLAVLNLANFPLGTVLGVYTFWVAYRLSSATESFG
jgi:hypothetical protein